MYGGLVMPGQSIFTPLFGVTGKQRDMALLPPDIHDIFTADTKSQFFLPNQEKLSSFLGKYTAYPL